MIGWLLDTNVVGALLNPKGAPSVKAWARTQDERDFFISILTLAEYDKGIFNLPTSDPNRGRFQGALRMLEARFTGRVLSVSDAAARRWGVVSGDVRRRTGHPPPVVDTLIAATAMEHDLYLVTRNVRDVRESGVAIFDPWQDDPAQFRLAR